MNVLLWILQGLGAVMYGASGIMKVFMFDRISADVRSFDALPRRVWQGFGVLELACVLGLVLPGVLHRQPALTGVAAALLAGESLVFLWVHARGREVSALVMSAVLGLLMAFVAWGRLAWLPLS